MAGIINQRVTGRHMSPLCDVSVKMLNLYLIIVVLSKISVPQMTKINENRVTVLDERKRDKMQ